MVAAPPLPRRYSKLKIRAGKYGGRVIKNPRTGSYYDLGEHESFILLSLDGTRDLSAVYEVFQNHFGYSAMSGNIEQFVDMARRSGLLEDEASAEENELEAQRHLESRQLTDGSTSTHAGQSAASCAAPERQGSSRKEPRRPKIADGSGSDSASDAKPQPKAQETPRSKGNLLYWRTRWFDPDELFGALEPSLRFIWTRAFAILSTVAIIAAAFLVVENRRELTHQFAHHLSGRMLIGAYLIMVIATLCHEFSHGLTCKHHGGEVHELGFLMMFFIPCLYCNVSDAWMIERKSHRLWVTLAGAWCDLCMCALAIFAWRITATDTTLNYVAWSVLSICGARILFNFNPLMKLDGYYLLSDWLEIPNLRQRAWESVATHARWMMWGGSRPAREERGRFLLGFGIASFVYSVAFLVLMLLGVVQFLGNRYGLGGAIVAIGLALMLLRNVFRGFAGNDFDVMLSTRPRRVVAWCSAIGAIALTTFIGRIDHRATGSFRVHPEARAEVRAPMTAFLREVFFEEGDRVQPGQIIAKLEVPDLVSRVAEKKAEVAEAEAKVQLLDAGTRPEMIREQTDRVARARAYRDAGRKDLEHAHNALAAELSQLDELIVQARLQAKFSKETLGTARSVFEQGAMSQIELSQAEMKSRVAESQLLQSIAQREGRAALGTTITENEVLRRDKELSEAESALTLMKAGSRPEEIAAERARLVRLNEELTYLEKQSPQLLVRSGVGGLIATPRLRQKVGQYFHEGELVCIVEEPARFEAEVSIAEQDAVRVKEGQPVELKARAGAFETIPAVVERVAPAASSGDSQSSVVIYCRAAAATTDLRPGMTGFARIFCGKQSVAHILAERVMLFARTEFWW